MYKPGSSFKIDLTGYKVEIFIGEIWICYKFNYNPYDGMWSIDKTTSEIWIDANKEFVD